MFFLHRLLLFLSGAASPSLQRSLKLHVAMSHHSFLLMTHTLTRQESPVLLLLHDQKKKRQQRLSINYSQLPGMWFVCLRLWLFTGLLLLYRIIDMRPHPEYYDMSLERKKNAKLINSHSYQQQQAHQLWPHFSTHCHLYSTATFCSSCPVPSQYPIVCMQINIVILCN